MCKRNGPKNHKEDAKTKQNNNHREDGLLKHSFTECITEPECWTSAHDGLRWVGSMIRVLEKKGSAMPATRTESRTLNRNIHVCSRSIDAPVRIMTLYPEIIVKRMRLANEAPSVTACCWHWQMGTRQFQKWLHLKRAVVVFTGMVPCITPSVFLLLPFKLVA